MIRTDLTLPLGYTKDDLKNAITSKLPIKADELKDYRLVKRSLDLKDKSNIHYTATVAIRLPEERERGLLLMRKKVSVYPELSFDVPRSNLSSRPIVIGAGPAGLFCALTLAISGARPILYERGLSVDERCNSVSRFINESLLDTESNIQYGEGGAGTFSDGKLKFGSLDKYKVFVLDKLIEKGAPEDSSFSTTAHVGTDKLREVVKGIREEIIALGGEVHFSAKLTSIKTQNGKIVGGRVEKNGEIIDFDAENLVIAAGHSARDTFELLMNAGASLSPRGFGIGLRVEHPREYINNLVYGEGYPSELETASYHLVTHLSNGRSAYSFCMCPGGSVVAAASERGGIVTNGMSEYSRNAENSNSALLVSVTPDDFLTDSPLAGIDLQRSIEKRAYSLTSSFTAPCVRTEDFLAFRESVSFSSVTPSYPLGVSTDSPAKVLPEYVSESLCQAIRDFDDWMPGFLHPDATLTAPETRSTSPIRVLRGDSFEALGIKGLYPIGEGAGYSGGIVSSARDGVMAAEAILLSHGV